MIALCITAYVVVGFGIFFGNAIWGDTKAEDAAWWAFFWLPTIVIFAGFMIVIAPFSGLGWVYEHISVWSKNRRLKRLVAKQARLEARLEDERKILEKLEAVKTLPLVDEQYPELASTAPIDYRHMNCSSCGHPLDKDTTHVDGVVIHNHIEKQ